MIKIAAGPPQGDRPLGGKRSEATPRGGLTRSFLGTTARARVAHLFDRGSVHEFLPPQESAPSPHLARLGLPGAFDDGVMCGRAASYSS